MIHNELEIFLDDEEITYRGAELGDKVEKTTNRLVCITPSIHPKYRKHTCYLKQQFMRTLMSMRKYQPSEGSNDLSQNAPAQENNNEEDKEADASQFLVMLYGGDMDIWDYQNRFKQMICGETGSSELVKVNDEIPFTANNYDKLSDEGLDKFMSEYVSFFLLRSLMGNPAKK